KDYIPTFPFIFPWDVLAHASALAAVSLMLLQDCRMNQTPIRANLPGRVRSRNDMRRLILRSDGVESLPVHFIGIGVRDLSKGSLPPSTGISTVPAISAHCSFDAATMRPSFFRQLPDPSW